MFVRVRVQKVMKGPKKSAHLGPHSTSSIGHTEEIRSGARLENTDRRSWKGKCLTDDWPRARPLHFCCALNAAPLTKTRHTHSRHQWSTAAGTGRDWSCMSKKLLLFIPRNGATLLVSTDVNKPCSKQTLQRRTVCRWGHCGTKQSDLRGHATEIPSHHSGFVRALIDCLALVWFLQ